MKDLKKKIFLMVGLMMGLTVPFGSSFAHPRVGTQTDHQLQDGYGQQSSSIYESLASSAVTEIFNTSRSESCSLEETLRLLTLLVNQLQIEQEVAESLGDHSYLNHLMDQQVERITSAVNQFQIQVERMGSAVRDLTRHQADCVVRQLNRIRDEMGRFSLLYCERLSERLTSRSNDNSLQQNKSDLVQMGFLYYRQLIQNLSLGCSNAMVNSYYIKLIQEFELHR